MVVDKIIADTIFSIITRELKNSDGGQNEHPSIRIKDLQPSEIHAFLEKWEEEAVDVGLQHVKVVIARGQHEEFLDEYVADEDKSVTYYRNNNTNGLVYIETTTQSDKQGLESIFTIRDRNLLDQSFDKNGFDVRKQMIQSAWRSVGGAAGLLPASVHKLTCEVLDSIHPVPCSVSARSFADFISGVCEKIKISAQAVSIDEVGVAVGASLASLGLFPDELWYNAGSESQKKRRLCCNYRFSELTNPSGADCDADDLIDAIDKKVFKNQDDEDIASAENQVWRTLCSDFCRSRKQGTREQIPFFIFSQLFTKIVQGLPLGEKIEHEIFSQSPGRISEYEALDVKNGISEKLAVDAQKLLEATPADDEPKALRDLLSKTTLKQVEKIAFPRAHPFVNPLIQIVEIMREFSEELNPEDFGQYVLRLQRTKSRDNSDAMAALFAFVYGNILSNISEGSQDDACSVELSIDPSLLEITSPSVVINQVISEDEDDADDKNLEWSELPVEFLLMKKDTSEVVQSRDNLIWKPERVEWLAFVWLFSYEGDVRGNIKLSLPDEDNFDEFISGCASLRLNVSQLTDHPIILEDAEGKGLLQELAEVRGRIYDCLQRVGVAYEQLNESIDEWERLLSRAQEELVPSGAIDYRLQALLSGDVIYDRHRGMAVMLASHPIRLKWISRYFCELKALCLSALQGDLLLNEENDAFYLRKLKGMSPHKYPPFLSADAHSTLLASESIEWNEIFAPLDLSESSESSWNEIVDSESVAEIARQAVTYLESHPYKADGLSMLAVLPLGGHFPVQLVNLLRKGEWSSVSLSFHVVAPRRKWEHIIADFEELKTENRLQLRGRLFPPIQLQLHEWTSSQDLSSIAADKRFDIAVVPNYFGTNVDVSERTMDDVTRSDRFNVLYDRTAYVDKTSSSSTVSIILKPYESDATLDAWSSVNVRLKTSNLVTQGKPLNTDFIQMSVMFEKTADLFSQLHHHCHWVITMDEYVGRDQIETLPERPDILTVKENVGANGAYTMVVSSNIGRDFIIQRLARKLGNIAVNGNVAGSNESSVAALAEKIYDSIRHIAPGLALRAMGLSRATEEILGLVIAMEMAKKHYPLPPGDGVSFWISLDEHLEWFTGLSATRADLCRIAFVKRDERLSINILVVEGKLRQSYDAHGIEQVSRSKKLLEAIFTNSGEYKDAALWRTEILSAIENSSGEAVTDLSGNGRPASTRLSDEFRDALKQGEFDVECIDGLFSICLYGTQGNASVEITDENITVVKTDANQIADLVERGGMPEESVMPVAAPVAKPAVIPVEAPVKPKVSVAVTPEVAPVINRTYLSVEVLESKFQTILNTLDEFKVPVSLPDTESRYTEGPACIGFRVKPGDGVKPNRISELAESFKLKLSLPEEARIDFRNADGLINIVVPKPDSERYFVYAEDLWDRWNEFDVKQLAVPFGEDQSGEIVSIDFSSNTSPHLLIGGTTGSGKSEALNTILKGMVRYFGAEQLRFLLVDPKGTELVSFENSDHLLGNIGWDGADAIEKLEMAVTEMQQRYQTFKECRQRTLSDYNAYVAPELRKPWWVIVLDEYADLTSEKEEKTEVESLLKRLAQKGRASGIHVIVATQKPSGDVISTNVRSNLPAQLALRVRSAIESRVIMGEKAAETLTGKGDAFFNADGKLRRVQCAIVRGVGVSNG